jgi:hypothetical protein
MLNSEKTAPIPKQVPKRILNYRCRRYQLIFGQQRRLKLQDLSSNLKVSHNKQKANIHASAIQKSKRASHLMQRSYNHKRQHGKKRYYDY